MCSSDLTRVIPVNWPKRIVISRPKVVDVMKVTNDSMTIVGKAQGESMLTFWDKFGRHTRQITVYSQDMAKVKTRIDNLISDIGIKGIRTKADNNEGKVLLLGEVENKSDKDKLFLALGSLKDKTVDLIDIRENEASVEISVQILELDEDAVKTLGFDLPSSISLTESSGPTSAAVTGLGALLHVSDWTRSAFNAKLDFLMQQGKARVLSRPRLVCRSGKQAKLLVGGEVPILTTQISGTGGGQGNNIEYKEYGIKLDVQPTVVSNNKINIKLSTEVSDIQSVETLGPANAPTAKAYPLSKRTMSTELSLKNGATVSIGGLIANKSAEDLKKFPWLADVPVLGAFFRHKIVTSGGGAGQKGNTELYITLTPRIINIPASKSKKTAGVKYLSNKEETLNFYKEKNIPDNLQGYVYKIQKIILSHISYPPMLNNTGWNANLILSLRILSTGELKKVAIIKPSGYKIFDDSALDTVKKLSYPPFPSSVHLEKIDMSIPIAYKSK